jgi:hypothetical protein
VETIELPPGRHGLIDWARANPMLQLGRPEAAVLGGLDATAYDIALSGVCDLPATKAVEVFSLAETPPVRKQYVMQSLVTTRWIVSEVDGQALIVAIDSPSEFGTFERKAKAVLSTIALTA